LGTKDGPLPATAGAKRECGADPGKLAKVQCRGCPRNCVRRAILPLWPLDVIREGRRMVTTREPGDLPFDNRAFPGGVLRMKLFVIAGRLALLLRTPNIETRR
jgi:hypothetical protein